MFCTDSLDYKIYMPTTALPQDIHASCDSKHVKNPLILLNENKVLKIENAPVGYCLQ